MANLPPADSLEGMARWMHDIERRLEKAERGASLSGQVSVGSLRIGGLLITADNDGEGQPMLVLRRDTSGPSVIIATLPTE